MTDRRELLVEIGSEEVPAGEVMMAVWSLRDQLVAGLDEARLAHGEPRTYATPRRLAVIVPDVEAGHPGAIPITSIDEVFRVTIDTPDTPANRLVEVLKSARQEP